MNAALGYLVEHGGELGIDPDRIILAGDSAGAQIAAQVALLTHDAAYARALGIKPTLTSPRIRGLVLVSGAYDLGAIDLKGDYGWFIRSVLRPIPGVMIS